MKELFKYLLNKVKTLFDAATTDPIAFIKNMVWSADHSEHGFSQKKIIGYGFFLLVTVIESVWLSYAYKAHDWGYLTFILSADLSFVSFVIGMNYAHEKAIMQNNKPPQS